VTTANAVRMLLTELRALIQQISDDVARLAERVGAITREWTAASGATLT